MWGTPGTPSIFARPLCKVSRQASLKSTSERACRLVTLSFARISLFLHFSLLFFFLYILAFEERRAARVDESYARERAHTVCLRKHVACPRDLPSDTQKDAPRRCSVLTVAKLLSASCSLRIGSEQNKLPRGFGSAACLPSPKV